MIKQLEETLLEYFHDSAIFQFFYSIYDYFQPQKKFYLFSFGSHNTTLGFKELSNLLYSSNNVAENPEDINKSYFSKTEYKNFYLSDRGLSEYTQKRYLYPSYIRGSEGLVIWINIHWESENVEDEVNGKFTFSLQDMLELSKCDDNIPLPNTFHGDYKKKENDFRPILFVISSPSKETNAKIEKFLEIAINEAGYEKENTMIAIHSDEGNIYQGLEWLFQKRCE